MKKCPYDHSSIAGPLKKHLFHKPRLYWDLLYSVITRRSRKYEAFAERLTFDIVGKGERSAAVKITSGEISTVTSESAINQNKQINMRRLCVVRFVVRYDACLLRKVTFGQQYLRHLSAPMSANIGY